MFDEMLNMLTNDLSQPTKPSIKPYEPLQIPILPQPKVDTPKSQPYNPIKIVKKEEKAKEKQQIQMPPQIAKKIQQLPRNSSLSKQKQQQSGNININNIKQKPQSQLQSQSQSQQKLKPKLDIQKSSIKNTKIQDPKIIKKQSNTQTTTTNVKPIIKVQNSTQPKVFKESKQSPTDELPLPMIEKKKSVIPTPQPTITKEIVKTPQSKIQYQQPTQPSQVDIEVQKLRQLLLQGQQKQKKPQPKIVDKKKQQNDPKKKQTININLHQSKSIKKIDKVLAKKKISADLRLQEDYDANDSFIDDNEDDLDSTEQREIQQVMKKLREKKKKIVDDDDDEDDIREVGFAQIEKEQQISRYIGYMEDERELKYIKRQEAKEREREREKEKEKEKERRK